VQQCSSSEREQVDSGANVAGKQKLRRDISSRLPIGTSRTAAGQPPGQQSRSPVIFSSECRTPDPPKYTG